MKKEIWPYLVIAIVLSLFSIVFTEAGFFKLQQDKLTDLLFSKKQNPNQVVIVSIDDSGIGRIGQWPWPRAVFGKIISRLQSANSIGFDINFTEQSRIGPSDDQSFASAIGGSAVPVVLNSGILSGKKQVRPIEILAKQSILGFPDLIADPDGNVRIIRYSNGDFLSLSAQLASIYNNKFSSGSSFQIPANPIRIAYLGPDGNFPSVSASDLITDKLPSEFFKNKIVLVGATAKDLQDYHFTPFGIMSGVEIQANAVQTLLNQSFFSQNRLLDVLLSVLFSFFTVWLCYRIKKLSSLILSIIGLLAFYNFAVFIFFDRFFILDMLYPNLSVITGGALTITYRYFSTSKEKKFIQETFGRYLDPEVVNKIIENPDLLKLGGEKKEITVLFSDIRGFTSFSEKMSPEELIKFLNMYLSSMTNAIVEKRGLVDKYIGDAIMAFWGAPTDNPNQATDAIEATLEMMARLEDFNNDNKNSTHEPVNIGIGINTGDVTVGNVGSEKRFDYTVIGDNVNLASRLEGLNKIYGTNIIISESTKNRLGTTKILVRELDRVRVKGKKEFVTIFEVIPASKTEAVTSFISDFQTGLSDYYSGNFKKSADIFEAILSHYQDGPSLELLNRCREFQKNPPADWHGVWDFKVK